MPPHTVLSAVIYARVSDDDQRRGRSVGEQEQECRDAAGAEGWAVDRVFVDNDRSASRYARRVREDYTALIAYLGTFDVGVLILWESSRGDRELESWAGLLNLCRRREVLIHVVTHNRTYDLNNARDWRTLAEDGVDSAYESEKTRARILRNVRANAAAGRPHGRLLYGYRRVYDSRGAFVEQVPDDDQAAVVREAARRVKAGESCYSVAQNLNDRGVAAPRGGRWDLTQIRRLVTNPAYAGHRVHRGQIVGPAVWSALIDEATYAACVARMADPRRKTVRDASVKHWLSGALKCAVCGGRTRVQKNRTHFAYLCVQGFCVSVRVERVEDFVERMVVHRLEQPDVLEILAGPDDDVASTAAAEAAELRTRLDGFYAEAAEGKVSPAGLAAIEARLLPQLRDAEDRSRRVEVPALLVDAAGPDAAVRWANFTVGQRREIVALLADLQIDRTRPGARAFDPWRMERSKWQGAEETWGDAWRAAGLPIFG